MDTQVSFVDCNCGAVMRGDFHLHLSVMRSLSTVEGWADSEEEFVVTKWKLLQ